MEPRLFPAINELKSADYNNLKETELNQVVLFLKEGEDDAIYVEAFHQAAEKRHGSKTVFFKSYINNEISNSIAADFGFTSSDLPKLVAFKFGEGEGESRVNKKYEDN